MGQQFESAEEIIENLPLGLFRATLDEAGRFLDVNQELVSLLDADSKSELVDHSILDFYQNPPDRSEFLDQLKEQKQVYEKGIAVESMTGREFMASVTASLPEEEDPSFYYGTFQDMAAQKRPEKQQLAAEQNRFRAITNAIPDVAIVYDRQGNYREVLTGQEKLLADDVSELKKRNVREVLDSDAAEIIIDGIETSLDTDSVQITEYSVDLDGDQTWFEGRIAPLPGKERDEAVVLARNITERKEYQRQIEQQRDDLDTLNQMLRHDIRNDLQLVTSYAELLAGECETLDEKVEQDVQQYIETIQDRASHSIELTTTAREMAATMLTDDEGLESMDLHRILETEVEEVQAAFPESTVTIESSIQSTKVYANNMLGSVFRNLLKNGIQHNNSEVPQVGVSVTESGTDVVVRVADNGPGIPEERKETIFGKGEKGLDSEGSGIGLYLVQRLVKMYGGSVWIEDNDPDGSVFVVKLQKASGA